jgi:hypothetical protein
MYEEAKTMHRLGGAFGEAVSQRRLSSRDETWPAAYCELRTLPARYGGGSALS